MAIAGLGLAVAGSISLTNASALDAGSIRDALGADVTKAVPAAVSTADDQPAGATEPDGGVRDQRGDLDSFDRRQQSTSRDVVRKQLDKAIVTQKSKRRTADLDDSSKRVQENGREISQKERTKGLAQTAADIKAEQKRLKEEREKRLADARKRAEEGKKSEQQGLPAPATPEVDMSGIVSDGSGVFPLAPGTYSVGARFGEYGSWARWHTGQDLAASQGTPIRATLSGKVVPGNADSWAGNHVAIKHPNGGSTLYAHMSAKVVQPGDTVKAGQIIGYVGSTGRSFGPHLHMEYYPKGTTPGDIYAAKDAMAYMRANGVKI
ncbi:MAG: peptidoglycan DD-metalloendopeptidase family protein [Propionibacteriales bacterium]|nr:peptidoglycan DD-metalloendopeptidase family protein [Propionibacteriales bacterium]